MLPNAIVTSYMRLFTFKLIKIRENIQFRFAVALATIQVLNSHMWLLTTEWDREDVECIDGHRNFYGVALVWVEM